MVNMSSPNYAGFWIRVAATLLDMVVIGLPVQLLSWGLIIVTGVPSMSHLIQLGAVALIIYLDGTKGGTPGKLVLHLRIVNERGDYIGIPGAILRYLGKILSGMLFGIGYLMVAWDKKKQGLHDKIAKTYVVKV